MVFGIVGLHSKGILYFREIAEIVGYDNLHGIRLCELGNTHLRRTAKNIIGKEYRTAHTYYNSLGIDCVSIDINGLDGALPLDLNKPIPSRFVGIFDFLVDSGTSEHIENQYELFRSIFRMLKVGGIFIHMVPAENNWAGHGIWRYSVAWFERLVKLCCYRKIDHRITDIDYMYEFNWKDLIFFSGQKTEWSEFCSVGEFVYPAVKPKGKVKEGAFKYRDEQCRS